jgi:ribonuclease Y
MNTIIISVVGILIGAALGYYARKYIALAKQQSAELQVKQAHLVAKEESQKIIEKAEKKAEEILDALKEKETKKEAEFKENHQRLLKKEELLDQRSVDIDKDRESIAETEKQLEERKNEIAKKIEEAEVQIAKISGLTKEEAKEQLTNQIKKDYEEDLMGLVRKMENTNKEAMHKRAQEILVTAMQRLAQPAASDLTTTSVSIPSDDLKGKIIGKEGRNIRAFERAAGVELIVDDTPGSIVVSSFDPIRRQVARVALENLIMDGRIQPAKIEEFVKKAESEINQIIKEKGEAAVYELKVLNLDPRVIAILGRLYFRTSYGQNVLQHSVEMAHLAGMIAEEIGADVAVAKAGALVHDIGKALDHEIQGSHIEIGIRILRKFGVSEKVIDAMKSHHDDYPHDSLESIIVQTADMLSGGRPGARRDTLENYLKRLEELENVATGFFGISKAYALSAGREIRVFVEPKELNDLEAHQTAREIARKIEADLTYPGTIKVVVIRENRVIEYAK